MNEENTTFSPINGNENAGEEPAVDDSLSWQLVVAVAVLSTVVGLALLVACGWGCWNYGNLLVCARKKGEDTVDHFPPPHRDAVELSVFSHSTTIPTQQSMASNVVNNNSGVSQGLGLGESQAAGELPVPPPPRSWTPSPPFRPNQLRNHPPKRVRDHVLFHNKPVNMINGTGGNTSSSNRGHNSPYNPRPNTLNTDFRSTAPSSTPSTPPRYMPVFYKSRSNHIHPRYLSPCWVKMPVLQRPSRRKRSNKHNVALVDFSDRGELSEQNHSPHVYFQDSYERNVVDSSGREIPVACSSQHGFPQPSTRRDMYMEPHGWTRRYMGPGSCSTPPSRSRCYRNHHPHPVPPNFRNARSSVRKKYARRRQSSFSGPQHVHHSHVAELPPSIPSSHHKPQNQKRHRRAEFVDPWPVIPLTTSQSHSLLPPPRPYSHKLGLHHHKEQQPQHISPYRQPRYAFHQDAEEDCHQKMDIKLTNKHSFYKSCDRGHACKHLQPIPRKKKSRSTQTYNNCSDSSTPSEISASLSWDNLTPDPSSVLTLTPDQQLEDNEAHENDGCVGGRDKYERKDNEDHENDGCVGGRDKYERKDNEDQKNDGCVGGRDKYERKDNEDHKNDRCVGGRDKYERKDSDNADKYERKDSAGSRDKYERKDSDDADNYERKDSDNAAALSPSWAKFYGLSYRDKKSSSGAEGQ